MTDGAAQETDHRTDGGYNSVEPHPVVCGARVSESLQHGPACLKARGAILEVPNYSRRQSLGQYGRAAASFCLDGPARHSGNAQDQEGECPASASERWSGLVGGTNDLFSIPSVMPSKPGLPIPSLLSPDTS